LVGDRQHQEQQDRGADDLVQQRGAVADVQHTVAGQGGEDPLGGDSVAGVDGPDRLAVRRPHDQCGDERAQHLGGAERQHLAPLETPEHRKRQRYRGIEMRPADPARRWSTR